MFQSFNKNQLIKPVRMLIHTRARGSGGMLPQIFLIKMVRSGA